MGVVYFGLFLMPRIYELLLGVDYFTNETLHVNIEPTITLHFNKINVIKQ